MNDEPEEKLEVKLGKTADGMFDVRYAVWKGPLDTQRRLFAEQGLHLPSPAEQFKLMIGASPFSDFLHYGRTNMDVLYSHGTVELIKGGPLVNEYIDELMAAHRAGKEFLIKDPKHVQYVNDIVQKAIQDGTGLRIKPGLKTIPTNEFNSRITDFLFSDAGLEQDAAKCGLYLNKNYNLPFIGLKFDDNEYIDSQQAPYLTILKIRGPGGDFKVHGDSAKRLVDGKAIGVDFKRAA